MKNGSLVELRVSIFLLAIMFAFQSSSAQDPSGSPEQSERGSHRQEEFPAIAACDGYVADEMIFDTETFDHAHTSTICQTAGGLVAAWVSGHRTDKSDDAIYCSYHDGSKWSSPSRVATGLQDDGSSFQCWNPVLFSIPGDGPLLMFFKVGASPSTWWGEIVVSNDGGRAFGERKRLPGQVVGPVVNKPLLVEDGKRLLCGASTEDDGWQVHFESIGLNGRSLLEPWIRSQSITDESEGGSIQPTFLRLADGRIKALCRCADGVISQTFSSDQGKTWTSLQATALPNPNSAIDAVTLRDGRHLLVYNPTRRDESGTSDGRHLLSVAISSDGQTWRRVGDLENAEGEEFCYPAVIQSDDGLVHITYSHRRKTIKHVTLDPAQWPSADPIATQ